MGSSLSRPCEGLSGRFTAYYSNCQLGMIQMQLNCPEAKPPKLIGHQVLCLAGHK